MNKDVECGFFLAILSFAVSWRDVWYREILGVTRISLVGCNDSFPNFRLTQTPLVDVKIKNGRQGNCKLCSFLTFLSVFRAPDSS